VEFEKGLLPVLSCDGIG